MKGLLLAASIVALSTAAHAGITCNLTDQRGNALQYSFAHGGHGYTNEIVVRRNGATISNGGPMWTRAFDRARRTLTLQQADWSIVYDSDTGHDQAALFHNANQVATGVCDPDYAVDAPSAPIEASTPAPTYPAPAAAPTNGGDAVGILTDGTRAFVTVHFGSDNNWRADMLIDTGANVMSIGTALANNLVQHGDAHYTGDTTQSLIANGATVTQSVLMIDRVTIGRHTLYNIPAAVTQGSDVTLLLPFQVLNQMGRFTIDTRDNLLVFG
jgi:predicted aspartyl protease